MELGILGMGTLGIEFLHNLNRSYPNEHKIKFIADRGAAVIFKNRPSAAVLNDLCREKERCRKLGLRKSIGEIAKEKLSPRNCEIIFKNGKDHKPALNAIDTCNYDTLIDVWASIYSDNGEENFLYLKNALSNGNHVVTAGKAHLAYFFGKLDRICKKKGVQLRYEASVAGSLPLFDLLERYLSDPYLERVNKVQGILNGTCNCILTCKFKNPEKSLVEIYDKLKGQGAMEANPYFDLAGIDQAAKTVILANKIYHKNISLDDIPNLRAIIPHGSIPNMMEIEKDPTKLNKKIRELLQEWDPILTKDLKEEWQSNNILKLVSTIERDSQRVRLLGVNIEDKLLVHDFNNSVEFSYKREIGKCGSPEREDFSICVSGPGAGPVTIVALVNDIKKLKNEFN